MYIKGLPWTVLLSSYFHSIFCQNITFTSTAGITYDGPECGLEENTGSWSMNADVTIPNKTDFNPQIIVERGIYELCRVNLTTCPPASPPPVTEDACYCTSNSGNDYSLLVRQIARKEHSQAKLKVTYRAISYYINNIYKSQVIGSLPVMYEPVTSLIKILGCLGTEACKGQPMEIDPATYVAENTRIKLELCVKNLLGGSLTISINDLKIFVRNETSDKIVCGKIGLKTRSEGKAVLLSLTYMEYNGCKRSGNYTVNLVAVKTDSLLSVENKSARKTCPNMGVTLPALIVVIMVVT